MTDQEEPQVSEGMSALSAGELTLESLARRLDELEMGITERTCSTFNPCPKLVRCGGYDRCSKLTKCGEFGPGIWGGLEEGFGDQGDRDAISSRI